MGEIISICFELDEHDENISYIMDFLGAINITGRVTRNDCYFNSYSVTHIHKKLISKARQIRFTNNPLDYLAIITNKKNTKVVLYLSSCDKEFNITKHISHISYRDENSKSNTTLFEKNN